MKTINKTLALLFATVAFTACTSQSIEPIGPATQPQSIVRPDTAASGPYRIVVGEDEQPKPQRGKVTTGEEPDRNNFQPQPTPEPTPKPMPHIPFQPIAQPDTMVY